MKHQLQRKPLRFCIPAVFAVLLMMTVSTAVKGVGKIDTSVVEKLKITILYDNYVFTEGTKPDWGFSCLVEGPEKTILFDTGTQPSILKENADKLKVDLSRIDLAVISHTHLDHLGGLPAALEMKSPLDLYLPESIPAQFLRNFKDKDKINDIIVKKPTRLCSGVILTGPVGGRITEQVMIINTPKGFVVITGCAHPGIIKILKEAKELTGGEIYLVLGGFHLLQDSDEKVEEIIKDMKSLGVKKCSASHCTGPKAIEMIKKAFGEDFIQGGVGRTVTIE